MAKNQVIELGMLVNIQLEGKKMRLIVTHLYAPEGEGYAGIDVKSPIGKNVLASISNGPALAALATAARAAYVKFYDTQIVW